MPRGTYTIEPDPAAAIAASIAAVSSCVSSPTAPYGAPRTLITCAAAVPNCGQPKRASSPDGSAHPMTYGSPRYGETRRSRPVAGLTVTSVAVAGPPRPVTVVLVVPANW